MFYKNRLNSCFFQKILFIFQNNFVIEKKINENYDKKTLLSILSHFVIIALLDLTLRTGDLIIPTSKYS